MQDPDSQVKRKKKRTVEVVEKEIQEIQKELQQIKMIENNGWILVDFPTNFSQAMLLEKALSGYQMPADLGSKQRDLEYKDANLLIKPTEQLATPRPSSQVESTLSSGSITPEMISLDENLAEESTVKAISFTTFKTILHQLRSLHFVKSLNL